MNSKKNELAKENEDRPLRESVDRICGSRLLIDEGVGISHLQNLIREAQGNDWIEIVLLVIDENPVQIEQERLITDRLGTHRGKACNTAVALIDGQPIAH